LPKTLVCCATVLTLFATHQVIAKERPWRAWPTGNRFAIAGGGFRPNLDTKIRLDGSDGQIGTVIDFESNLGMQESKSLPLLRARWRISRRNAIDFGYFNLNRSGQALSDVSIRFGDVEFPANIPLNSFFDSQAYSAAWSYSFIHNDRTDIAFQVGLNVQDIRVGIRGPAGIPSEEAELTAPLPTLGLPEFPWIRPGVPLMFAAPRPRPQINERPHMTNIDGVIHLPVTSGAVSVHLFIERRRLS